MGTLDWPCANAGPTATGNAHDQTAKSAKAAVGARGLSKLDESRKPTELLVEPAAPNLPICFSKKAAHFAELVIAVLSQLLG